LKKIARSTPKCSICGGPLYEAGATWKGGNNAGPINKGRCCNVCNETVVVPARISFFFAAEQRNHIAQMMHEPGDGPRAPK
jgi:hypothetical protein